MTGRTNALALAAAILGGGVIGVTAARLLDTCGLDPAARVADASLLRDVEREALLRRLAAQLVELPLPHPDQQQELLWAGIAALLGRTLEAFGLPVDLAADEAAGPAMLGRWRQVGAPEELAAVLDLLGELEERAGHREASIAASTLASALDDEPTRVRVRAALIEANATALRELNADADATKLPLRTAALLGAALLRMGESADAFDVWRTAALEHPADLSLHTLIGWAARSRDGGDMDEAGCHLEAACALRPESRTLQDWRQSLDP